MITLTYIELLKIISVIIVLSVLNNLQFALKPADYFSIRAIAVNADKNRIVKSSFLKIFITFAVCFIFHFLSFSDKVLLLAFFIKEFLQIWVAMVQLKIFSKWNKFKIKYFFTCICYFLSALFYAWWSLYQLIPAFTEGKPLLLFSNDFANVVISMFLYIVPIPLDYGLISSKMNIKYTDIDSFHADTIIAINQMDIESLYVDEYNYEIQKYSKENNIPYELLHTILCLEYANRSSYGYKFIENVLVKFFKNTVVKMDISIGLSQIKPSTAKELLKKSPYEFLDDMMNNDFSIQLCAKLLRSILDKYEIEFNQYIENDFALNNIWCYIASEYLCGCATSYRRNTLIYETILATECQDSNIYDYLKINTIG